MRILILSHKFYPDIGGIEINSEILARSFSKRNKSEIHLLTWSKDPNCLSFPFKVIRNPGVYELFKEYLWADAVFENNPSLKMSWPLLVIKKPHIVAVRTWINRPSGNREWRDKLKIKWLKRANAVIAVSQEIKNSTMEGAVVIGNPYRDNLFIANKQAIRKRDFVYLGRLVSDKGVDLAVSLLNLLNKQQGRKYNLTVIGKGPELENLKKMTVQFGLAQYVNFTGPLEGKELVKSLNRHKYLLIPSRWKEPFGNIALEGMACGCLPIVSNGGGLPDAVGNAGVVFRRNDINSFFEKVKELLEHPNFETSLRNNFDSHLEAHRADVISQRYFDIITEACH